MTNDIRALVCDKCGKVCAILSWDYVLPQEAFNNIEESKVLCKKCFINDDPERIRTEEGAG